MDPKKEKKEKELEEEETPESDPQEEDEIGGFPDRDLRKNLGCG